MLTTRPPVLPPGSNRFSRSWLFGAVVPWTIPFETANTQPSDVDKEKKSIYEPTVPYFLEKYNLKSVSVTGIFFGAQETISKCFVQWHHKYKIEKHFEEEIVTNIIKYTGAILRNHLYGTHTSL